MCPRRAKSKVATTTDVETDIDRRKCHRVVPMEVLCMGLSRTGTSSLREALLELGYHDVYHMASAMRENPRDCEMWIEAYEVLKEGKAGTFGRREWDQLLGHCMAATDNPCASFPASLLAAYPSAKVILTVRDSAAAYRSSAMATIYPWMASWLTPPCTPLHALCRWLQGPEPAWYGLLVKGWLHAGFSTLPADGERFYQEHNALVRRLVPDGNLLVFNVKEGWEPLCAFLDKDVPDVPFPHVNDEAEFRRNGEALRAGLRRMALAKGLKILLVLGMCAVMRGAWKRGVGPVRKYLHDLLRRLRRAKA